MTTNEKESEEQLEKMKEHIKHPKDTEAEEQVKEAKQKPKTPVKTDSKAPLKDSGARLATQPPKVITSIATPTPKGPKDTNALSVAEFKDRMFNMAGSLGRLSKEDVQKNIELAIKDPANPVRINISKEGKGYKFTFVSDGKTFSVKDINELFALIRY